MSTPCRPRRGVGTRPAHDSSAGRPTVLAFYLDGRAVQMSDQTYDEKRARRLEEMLRALVVRIQELDANGEMLRHASELIQRIGEVRSELFHYEVRATYDTPEVAESRKIVDRAKQTEADWERREWAPNDDDETTW
jgi:hypothetical protein